MSDDTKDDGGPAWPNAAETSEGSYFSTGMSLRDWFAGQALAGLLAMGANQKAIAAFINNAADEELSINAFLAKDAYAKADAMLAARKVPK